VQVRHGVQVRGAQFFCTSCRLTACPLAVVRRYLVAHNGDHDAAVNGLKATVEWRRGAVTPAMSCPRCVDDFASHCFIPLGHTVPESDATAPMPIVYASQPRAADPDIERQMTHMLATLEHVFSVSPTSHAWVWAIDFNGFGLREALAARVGINTVSVFSRHLPERMGRILLINPPGVFDLFLAALKPFIDSRTSSKIHSVHAKPEELATALRAHGIPPHLGEWIGRAAAMKAVPGNLPILPATAAPLQVPTVLAPHRAARYHPPGDSDAAAATPTADSEPDSSPVSAGAGRDDDAAATDATR